MVQMMRPNMLCASLQMKCVSIVAVTVIVETFVITKASSSVYGQVKQRCEIVKALSCLHDQSARLVFFQQHSSVPASLF